MSWKIRKKVILRMTCANKLSICVIMNLNAFKANLLTCTCKRGGSAHTILLIRESWTSFMNIRVFLHILYQSNIIPKVMRRHKTNIRLQNANSFLKRVLFLAAIDTTQLDKSFHFTAWWRLSKRFLWCHTSGWGWHKKYSILFQHSFCTFWLST